MMDQQEQLVSPKGTTADSARTVDHNSDNNADNAAKKIPDMARGNANHSADAIMGKIPPATDTPGE